MRCKSIGIRLIAAFLFFLALPSLSLAQFNPGNWNIRETHGVTIPGTLTWDAGRNVFAARWTNGASATLRVTRWDDQVVMERRDVDGVSRGLTAQYIGTRRGAVITGTVTWSDGGGRRSGTWQANLIGGGPGGPGGGGHVPASRFDLAKFPDARRAVLSCNFPRLGNNFEVLDPYMGERYNCIAHSLGIHSYWVNPLTGPAGSPLSLMDKMYSDKGYRRVAGLDFRLVPGQQKVVVYAKVEGGRITEVTHGALQERDGTWSSKLGRMPLIKHATPDALNGSGYGQPVAVYVRPA